MSLTLTEEDKRLREVVLINRGNLSLVAEQLDVSYSQVSSRLRKRRNIKWWKFTKLKFMRERAKLRNHRAYVARKLRGIESDLQRMFEKDKFP